jgi:D-alanyl-D-alanine carboxypeptidase/D-alanyl-D-alanine-endopeptidase (penicillin-binding protein 4)
MTKISYLVVLLALLSSCTPLRVKKAFHSSALTKQFSGVFIEEVATGKAIFTHNADQYFMPASNMKLATMLLAKRNLPDSIPAFKYLETADTLFFWGTGDPSLMHPKLRGNALLKKLQASNKVLVYADDESLVKAMGNGWAWDDYHDDYSAEISLMPLYNNQISVQKKAGVWQISPKLFSQDTRVTKQKEVMRGRNSNHLDLPDTTAYAKQAIPFITSVDLTARLLADTLKKPILAQKHPIPAAAIIHYDGLLDSLIRPMMYTSDNQIAEQLLYLIAAKRGWSGPTSRIIEQLKKENSVVADLRWVDGSGLSRYNLVRPTDMIQILRELQNEVPMETLQVLLPQAGQSGTMRNVKLHPGTAWAKSGSFGNTYDLSGFYQDVQGKMYRFSIFANLANRSVAAIKADVINLLNALR